MSEQIVIGIDVSREGDETTVSVATRSKNGALHFQNLFEGNDAKFVHGLINENQSLTAEVADRKMMDDLHKDFRGDFYSVYDELGASRRFLASEGYRRCDIAACNCGSWHDHSPTGYNGLNQKIDDLTTEVERLRERVRELQHLERTVISWLDAEDAYAAQQGEDIPYSVGYARIVEARIFNNQAIRRTIKALAALNKEGC